MNWIPGWLSWGDEPKPPAPKMSDAQAIPALRAIRGHAVERCPWCRGAAIGREIIRENAYHDVTVRMGCPACQGNGCVRVMLEAA